MSGYHHFTYEERLKIEALYKSKVPVKEIAQNLNVHNSSVYRELKRGEYQRMDSQTLNMYLSYSADIAQKKYDYNKTSKGLSLKLNLIIGLQSL
jgi:IS30 family transposase